MEETKNHRGNQFSRLTGYLAATLLAVAMAAPVFGQQAATGTIEGVVTDQNGAVVLGAKVAARNVNTGFTREITTDDNGIYRLTTLPPGTYQITASAPGFAENKFANITLNVGQKLNIDLMLRVNVSETIDITSQAAVVETTRTQVSGSVNERAVRELPVNGRNFLDFVTLTPGVVRDPRQGDLSFGGQKGTLNSIQIDGVDNNNLFFGQALGRTGSGRAPYQFSQDAVQEFQVNTNSFSAEFGRAAGGTINVITKSGTNEFHGTAFDFYRDRALNANSLRYDAALESFTGGKPSLIPNGRFFDTRRLLPDGSSNPTFNTVTGTPTKPAYHFHQFGGNFGGPIKTDRAFFFFNYDGQRNTQPNLVNQLPAAPASGGLAAINGRNKLLPLAGNYVRQFNQDVYLGKVDVQIDAANRLNFRYNRQNFTGTNLENGGATNSQEHSGDSLVTTDTFTTTLNTVFSPHLLNEFRAQVARDREPGLANSDNPEAIVSDSGQAVLTIGRNNFSPRETTEKKFQFIDNVSYITGEHSVKGGFDINIEKIKNFFPGFYGGGYTFTSYANFNNNVVASYTQAFAGDGTSGATTFPDFNEYGFFLQDDWRATKSLTLNFGVRYDIQKMKQGPTRNPNAALAAAGIDTSLINNDYNNVAPRFGFAFNPAGSRFVVRGGYGLFYGRTPAIALGTAHSNNGLNSISITLTNPTGLVYPFRFSSLAEIQSRGGSAATPNLFVFERDYQQPYTMQGSFGVEYGLSNDLSVGASYLFVRGRHLQRTRDINLLPPVATPIAGGIVPTFLRHPGATSPTRRIAGFGRISEFQSNSNSEYNAIVFQVNKRFARHFQALLSYTFSKVIDDAPDATSVVTGNAGDDAKQAQQSFLLSDERGPGNANTPHRFVASGLWDLDYFKGGGALRAILGGWQVGGIFQAASYLPYSARLAANVDLNNDGNRNSDRAPGYGRNSFHEERFMSFDFRTTKTFYFTEKYRLQFIAEFFNIFNRLNISSFNGQLYNVTGVNTPGVALTRRNDFGNPRGASDPRIGQLALKFLF